MPIPIPMFMLVFIPMPMPRPDCCCGCCCGCACWKGCCWNCCGCVLNGELPKSGCVGGAEAGAEDIKGFLEAVCGRPAERGCCGCWGVVTLDAGVEPREGVRPGTGLRAACCCCCCCCARVGVGEGILYKERMLPLSTRPVAWGMSCCGVGWVWNVDCCC